MQIGLLENCWNDSQEEGLSFFKNACPDYAVGNQYVDLYFSLYDYWKIFIREAAIGLAFSGISSVGDTGRISFLLYDNFAVYKIVCSSRNSTGNFIWKEKGESNKGELEKMDK